MERFSIEVTRRRVAAGHETKMPASAAPCDLYNCVGSSLDSDPEGASMGKADRNPEVRRPQDLSPLSDD